MKILRKLINLDESTDESTLIKENGYRVKYILGEDNAHKITFANDLKQLKCLKKPSDKYFIGNGFDVHQFQKEKQMVLCGVDIDVDYGFKAHSDGDVAIHALIDSLLGACGIGDIGELFPDSDDKFKNISSMILLDSVIKKIKRFGFEICNVDITIIAQKPRLSIYKYEMKQNLAKVLQLKKQFINIKATTTEKVGFDGEERGISARVVVLIQKQ